MILPSLPRVAIARHCALLVLLALAAASAHAASTRLEQQRRQFPAAYAAAKAGPGEHWRDLASGLEDYPLFPYLEGAALERELPRADARKV
ncbi:MAG: lytic murein transglycosylase, partial [Pseudoxanthomonas sp.]|nr:lytic murein transglycosylase [Pseudoxanthomonas sp.]